MFVPSPLPESRRPPAALWGYDMRSTDEALNMVARTVTDRDVEIAILRRQIADLSHEGVLSAADLDPDRIHQDKPA